MKKQYLISKVCLFALVTIILFSPSCKKPTVPPGVQGSFTTGSFGYNCFNGSPLRLTHGNGVNNGTRVTAQACSIAAPQFDSGLIVYGLNDSRISLSPFTNGCASMNFPETGEYTFVARFIEGVSNCQPSPNQCWRWFTMQTSPSGFVPNCGSGALFINTMDPSGFTGPCI